MDFTDLLVKFASYYKNTNKKTLYSDDCNKRNREE